MKSRSGHPGELLDPALSRLRSGGARRTSPAVEYFLSAAHADRIEHTLAVMSPFSRRTFGQVFALFLLVNGLVPPASLRGEVVAFELDPEQTTVTFSLGAFLHTVHGTFKLKHGSIRFDTDTGQATGEVAVDLTSGVTGNSSRDRKMQDEVLETRRYPEAVFSPDRVDGHPSLQGESQADLHGRMKIHGTQQELVLHVRAQWKDGQATATARFEVPYVKWGMKDPSTALLQVKDHVTVEVRTVARPSPARSSRATRRSNAIRQRRLAVRSSGPGSLWHSLASLLPLG